MRTKTVAMLVPAIALGVLAVPAQAQQHRATRLGNPATRFSRPMKQADDVRLLVRGERTKTDVAAILNEIAWKGSLEDLERAAAAAEISEVRIPTGTRLPFMASRLHGRPHVLVDVLWAGSQPIDALAFEFSSNCERYRLVIPRACGNFWIEDLGRDTAEAKCAPPAPAPVVSLSGADEACVAQPVEWAVNVNNPPADGKVTVYVNGQESVSDRLTDGAFRFTFAGGPTPGRYEVKAVSGGVSHTATVLVRPCPPVCSITASPLPVKAGQPLTVDLSGSRVAAGVRGGFRSARVEVVDPEGAAVDSFELAPGMRRSDVTLRKDRTLRAVVTDEAGQTSTNTCELQADVRGSGFPFFVGAYAGKERLFQEQPFYPGGRCAALIGAELGIQPRIAENTELEAAFGVKVNLRDSENTSVFGDAAINQIFGRLFLGGGVSAWDLTESDTRGIALLLQTGFDLSSDGKLQLVAQARAPFNRMSDIESNYMVWGGLRFRPFSTK